MVNNAIKWAGPAIIAYFVYRSVEALAGRDTMAKLVVEHISELKLHVTVPWILTAAAVAYGLLQRHLKVTTIERLGDRIKTLEKGLDPGRSSSKLTSRGETRPEDQV